MLRASRNATMRPIATHEPSLRDDWKTTVQKVAVDDTDLDDDKIAYASHLDAFIVFDANHHITREPARIRLATPAQSRKRKEHTTDHSDEEQRDLKRSRIARMPPRSSLSSSKQSTVDNLSLLEEPVSCLDRHPSHTMHTAEAHSTIDNTYRKPRENHEKPSRADDSLRRDHHHRARCSSRSPSHDRAETPYMESSSRSRHPARAKRDRSNSPLGSDAEADTIYRSDRMRGVSRHRATNMKDHTEQVINPKSMKTAQVTPEHESQLEDDTDLQGSRTSSSTFISHSTFAKSYGSNGSRTFHGTNDDPSKLSSSPTHTHTDDDAFKTGSSQPPDARDEQESSYLYHGSNSLATHKAWHKPHIGRTY
jgi:hypothetical protein